MVGLSLNIIHGFTDYDEAIARRMAEATDNNTSLSGFEVTDCGEDCVGQWTTTSLSRPSRASRGDLTAGPLTPQASRAQQGRRVSSQYTADT